MNGKDGWMDGQYGWMDRMDGRTEWNGMEWNGMGRRLI